MRRDFGLELGNAQPQRCDVRVVRGLRLRNTLDQPRDPRVEARAGRRRDPQRVETRTHAARIADRRVRVELHVRQEIDLVQDEQVRRMEHVRILERLVLAFGDREDHDLVRFAQIERGGADEIADVFDQQQAAVDRLQRRQRMAHHVRVEVAAPAGVDLHGGSAGRADAIGVERGLLVALDHRNRNAAFERLDRAHEERRLAGARTRDEVEREDAAVAQRSPVRRRECIVLRKDVLLDLHDARRREAGRMRCAEPAGGAEAMVVRAAAVVTWRCHVPSA